jgi:hypothetical protein
VPAFKYTSLPTAFVIGLSPIITSANELALTCTVHSVAPSASIYTDPYIFSILLDLNNRTILSVGDDGKLSVDDDGNSGSSWITDRFSETTIAAHFAMWNRTGTITLDRVTGVIEAMTELRLDEKIIVMHHGTCEQSKRKF